MLFFLPGLHQRHHLRDNFESILGRKNEVNDVRPIVDTTNDGPGLIWSVLPIQPLFFVIIIIVAGESRKQNYQRLPPLHSRQVRIKSETR